MMLKHTLAACLFLLPAATFADETKQKEVPVPSAAIRKPLPDTLEDLKEIQKQVKSVYDSVVPAVVGIQKGGAAGSGVIVSKDGLVLTAGHVSGEPGQPVTLILPDGKRLKGITLGKFTEIDSGMIRITDESKGDLPYAKMAKPNDFKKGDWCIAIGHPGGFRKERSPVVRVGKLLVVNDRVLQTDCTLVGGDSGGPLFDMQGRVIGIHSRIADSVTNNMHVPIGTYRDTWNRLLKGADIGAVWLGVMQDAEATKECKLGDITKDSPAAKAGLKVGDVITRFDNQVVGTYADMKKLLLEKDAGDEVPVELKRGAEKLNLTIKLMKRPADGTTPRR